MRTRVRLSVDLEHDEVVTPDELHGMAIDALATVCHVANDNGITVLDDHKPTVCPDCNGTGAVPAGGGEDPADVDNGYVRCPSCHGIKITDLDPFLTETSGFQVTVEIDGKTYKVEQWATSNSSGEEVYDEDGAAVYGDNTPEALVDWQMDEDPRVEAFWERYRAEVDPLIDRIKADVFGTSA